MKFFFSSFLLSTIFSATLSILLSCSPADPNGSQADEKKKFDVVIRIKEEPDNLNAVRYRTSSAILIKSHIYFTLTAVSPKTNDLIPVIAGSLPELSADGKSFNFTIRQEAVWDDGSPITGHDYAFTIRTINNPLVNSPHFRQSFSSIADVLVDPTNPKKLTVVMDTIHFLGRFVAGDIEILPEYVYDSNQIMRNFAIPDLKSDPKKFEKDSLCIAFAEAFNSEKFGSEIVVGSGPYKFESWVRGQSVTLKKKEDWWGLKINSDEREFQANPEKLVFLLIKDNESAEAALAKQEIDVLYTIASTQFEKLKKDPAFSKNYNFYAPETYIYGYIGMNNKPPAGRRKFFEDKRVRKAMAHLLDMDKVISDVLLGYGARTVGPVLPMRGPNEYNVNLRPVEYSLEKAIALMEEAGWKDSNGDGIRDKMIAGKRTEFTPELLLAPNREESEKLSLLFRQACEKAGVKININVQDVAVQRDMYLNHNFDMYISGFVQFPMPSDFKQLWHSSSWYNQGTNFWGFGSTESDSLIEQIRVTMSPEERKPMVYRFQEIVYDEQPVIFTYVTKEKIIINKKFDKPVTDAFRPGFHPQEWNLVK